MRPIRRSCMLGAALALTATAVAPAGAKPASHPATLVAPGTRGGARSGMSLSCGATITVSTRLDRDLVNCPNNGITIGADNITLDLNGHVIDGDGTEFPACPPDQPCDVGVVDLDHHGVRVTGGRVREFALGALVVGAADSRITRLDLSNHAFSGLVVADSARTAIDGLTASANGLTTDQAGISVFDSRELTFRKNTVVANGDIGLFISGLDDSILEGNSLSRNPEAAILLDHGNGNEFSRNRVSRGGDGIIVSGDRNTVAGNLLVDTGLCVGECGNGGYGISLEGGTGNVVEGNAVARSHQAGIRVASFEEFGGPPTIGNVVRRNLIQGSVFDGLLVETTATDTLVELNTAVGAGDDGIEIDNAAATLTRNLAARNGDHGIEAIAGVTDGGGNRAVANGNPIQCVSVAC
jgi:large repetitive protein